MINANNTSNEIMNDIEFKNMIEVFSTLEIRGTIKSLLCQPLCKPITIGSAIKI